MNPHIYSEGISDRESASKLVRRRNMRFHYNISDFGSAVVSINPMVPLNQVQLRGQNTSGFYVGIL